MDYNQIPLIQPSKPTNNLVLRDYQKAVIADLRKGIKGGDLNQMVALPTGAGKTAIATQIFLNAKSRGAKCLFVTHMRQLSMQGFKMFESNGLDVGLLQAAESNYSADNDVIVASIHSMRTRFLPVTWCNGSQKVVVVIDEAHQLYKAHLKLLDDFRLDPIIGLSATPLRRDLGSHFSRLVRGPTVADLQDAGHLVPIKAFAPEQAALDAALESMPVKGGDFDQKPLSARMVMLVADIVTTWIELGEDRPTLAFAVTKGDSQAMVKAFLDADVPAAHIEDTTPAEERAERIRDLEAGRIKILSSVGVLAIGFDCPIASCGILARPTLSLPLHIQQLGRLMRVAYGKKDALILDHSGNMLRHGSPRAFVVPSLKNGPAKEPRAKPDAKVRDLALCKSCGAILEVGAKECYFCGKPRSIRPTITCVAAGKLKPLGRVDTIAKQSEEEWTLEQRQRFFVEVAGHGLWVIGKTHSDAWKYARAVYRGKFGSWPDRSWQAQSPARPGRYVKAYIAAEKRIWRGKQKAQGNVCPP